MAKTSKVDTFATEDHSDAWERFERAVAVVAKSPPQHKTKKKKSPEKKSPKKKD